MFSPPLTFFSRDSVFNVSAFSLPPQRVPSCSCLSMLVLIPLFPSLPRLSAIFLTSLFRLMLADSVLPSSASTHPSPSPLLSVAIGLLKRPSLDPTPPFSSIRINRDISELPPRPAPSLARPLSFVPSVMCCKNFPPLFLRVLSCEVMSLPFWQFYEWAFAVLFLVSYPINVSGIPSPGMKDSRLILARPSDFPKRFSTNLMVTSSGVSFFQLFGDSFPLGTSRVLLWFLLSFLRAIGEQRFIFFPRSHIAFSLLLRFDAATRQCFPFLLAVFSDLVFLLFPFSGFCLFLFFLSSTKTSLRFLPQL